jgi:hypothetical protein
MHEYEEGDVIAVQSDEMKVEDSLKEDNTGYRYRDGYGLITDLGTTTISMKWGIRETERSCILPHS